MGRIRTTGQARRARIRAELAIFFRNYHDPTPIICNNCNEIIQPGPHVNPERWARLRDHTKVCI